MNNSVGGNILAGVYPDSTDIIKKPDNNGDRYIYETDDVILQRIKASGAEVVFTKIKHKALKNDKKAMALKEYNRQLGIKTVFMCGYAVSSDFLVRGFAHEGTAYIMYDHPYYSFEQINRHEIVHLKASSDAYKDFRDSVFKKLTTDEKSKILMALNKKYGPNFINGFLKVNPTANTGQILYALMEYLSEEAMANLNGGMDEMTDYELRFKKEISIFRDAVSSKKRIEAANKGKFKNFPQKYTRAASCEGIVRLSTESVSFKNELQNKNCVALHNLSAENFLRMYNKGYGGMPGISVAITDYRSNHFEHGAITFVLKPSAVNPANKSNLVFSSDAWSSMFPAVVMIPNKKEVEKLAKKLKISEFQVLNEYFDNKSEASAFKYLSEEKAIKELFVEEKTELNKNAFEELDEWDSEFAEELSPMIKRGVTAGDIINKDDERREFTEKLNSVIHRTGETDFGRPNSKLLELARNGNTAARDIFYKDWQRYERGSLEGFIKNNQKEFDKFVKNIVSNVSQGEILKDRAGNIYEDNVDNILKIMFRIDNNQFSNFESIDNLTAKLAKQYRSMDELDADRDKLLPLADDDRQKVQEGLNRQLSDIIDKIAPQDKYGDNIKNTGNILLKAAGEKEYSVQSVLKSFKEENIKIDEKAASDIKCFFDNIKSAPVAFFEAKLIRLLKWNEICGAIIPDNTDSEVISALNNLGIKIVKYKFENEESRLKAVQKFYKMRFSRENGNIVQDPLTLLFLTFLRLNEV